MSKNEVLTERDSFEQWYIEDAKASCGLNFTPGEIKALRDGDNYGDRAALNGKWEGWNGCLAKLTAGVELPPLSDEDRQFLHYNPNTSDLVEFVQTKMREAIAAERARLAGQEAVAVVDSGLSGGIGWTKSGSNLVDGQELYAAPVPAQAKKVMPDAIADAFDSIRVGLDAISKGGEPRINAAIATALRAQILLLEKIYTAQPTAPQSLLDAAEKVPVAWDAYWQSKHGEKEGKAFVLAMNDLRAALQEHGRTK
jgi:hypothetical protein